MQCFKINLTSHLYITWFLCLLCFENCIVSCLHGKNILFSFCTFVVLSLIFGRITFGEVNNFSCSFPSPFFQVYCLLPVELTVNNISRDTDSINQSINQQIRLPGINLSESLVLIITRNTFLTGMVTPSNKTYLFVLYKKLKL